MASDALPLRRGDVTFYAALTYIPRRRGAAHFEDNLSRCLWLSKTLPDYGTRWAREHWAPLLVEIVPEGTDLLVHPPGSRRRRAGAYYFTHELTLALGELTGLPVLDCLTWETEGAEAAKEVRHQRGQGRKLARRVRCEEDLSGLRVCVIDDLLTTGLTMLACRQAVIDAGAASCEGIALFRTVRTEADPARRDRLRQVAALRRGAVQARSEAREARKGTPAHADGIDGSHRPTEAAGGIPAGEERP